MITAVDTNILLDVLLPDPTWRERSLRLLHRCLEEGSLCICDVVAAELGAHFSQVEPLERFLHETGIGLSALSLQAAQAAGVRWRQYCKHRADRRDRVVADFMIAAHAHYHAHRLLTRDLGFYRSHFQELKLLQPGT